MTDPVNSRPTPGGNDRPPTLSPRVHRRHGSGRLRLLHLVLVVGLAAAAGCGSSGPTAPASAEAATTAAADTMTTTSVENGSRGGATPVEVTDVVYDEDPRRQVLDVHVPAGDGPFPTILAIHGGRFKLNSKRLYDRHAAHFVDRGVALVATNYRFVPQQW